MKQNFCILVIALSVAVLPLTAQGQTTRKPAPRPAYKTVARPMAKPSPQPVLARAATQPVPAAPAPSTQPARLTSATSAIPFEVGTNVLNLGIGLGSRYGYGAGYFGGSSSVSPAISLSFERGILPLGPGVLGVGVFAGYQGATYKFATGDKWKYSDVIFTVRSAFHYPVLPQLDAYGGLGLGVRHAGVTADGSGLFEAGSSSANELASGLFVGGRYFFTEMIGAFAELGYDQTYLKVGVAARF